MSVFGGSGNTSNIGSFLDSVNARRGTKSKAPESLDVEAAGERVLAELRHGPQSAERVRLNVELPDSAFETVIRRLERAGMVRLSGQGPGTTVELTEDAAGKRVLALLNAGPQPAGRLQADLAMGPADFEPVVARLAQMGMVRMHGEGPGATLELSDFARDAMKVFQIT